MSEFVSIEHLIWLFSILKLKFSNDKDQSVTEKGLKAAIEELRGRKTRYVSFI
jgi:hypothetical protein